MSNKPGSNEDEKLNGSTGEEQSKNLTLTIDIERQREADRKAEQNLERGDKEHGRRLGS